MLNKLMEPEKLANAKQASEVKTKKGKCKSNFNALRSR